MLDRYARLRNVDSSSDVFFRENVNQDLIQYRSLKLYTWFGYFSKTKKQIEFSQKPNELLLKFQKSIKLKVYKSNDFLIQEIFYF